MSNGFYDMKQIDNINIFQNKSEPRYNSCAVIYKDSEGKTCLLYIEKIDNSISIAIDKSTYENDAGYIMLQNEFILQNMIRPVKGTLCRTVDLSFPSEKPMSKKDIEEELGYKISII